MASGPPRWSETVRLLGAQGPQRAIDDQGDVMELGKRCRMRVSDIRNADFSGLQSGANTKIRNRLMNMSVRF